MILVDWSRLLTEADGYETRPPVEEDELAAYPELPPQLRKLYLVSDGVFNRYGQWFLVWPLAELAARNELSRAEPAAGEEPSRAEPAAGEEPSRAEPAAGEEPAARKKATKLLAFGDDGTGGRFCVLRDAAPGVFLWDPFLATPRWLANDLGDFWLGWTTGTITTFDQAA
ncbi:SMI1/KNR4 family protein [Actinoplanes sp. NPDC049596]|uniref:SMI1/KNR4 family protein n=1 Tax=unclassified Actinoplanes TaxID=2626549 RepID=UPI003437BD06